MKLKQNKPTKLGSTILELLCTEVALCGEHEIGRKAPLDKTEIIVKWLASKMGRTVKSVAGALSDLIDKGFLSNDWKDDFDKNIHEVSITSAGWQQWSAFDIEDILDTLPFENATEEDFQYWLDWDGLDCTCVGSEHELKRAKVFR